MAQAKVKADVPIEALLKEKRKFPPPTAFVKNAVMNRKTGHILITPLPGLTILKPGSATLPFPGVDAEVFDEKGNPAKSGYLVLRKPWPGMLRGIWGDPDRFVKQYWSKYDNFSAELPKTRSGKIMRRLLRDIAEGRALGDTTTLADPAVVASLKTKYEELES